MVDSNSRKDGSGANAARFFGVGFAFILAFAVPTIAGYVVDELLGTLPLFLLLGLAAGFAGGLYYVYRKIKEIGTG